MKKYATLENLLIMAIFSLAAFLRFYRVKENLFFNGEVGNDFVIIRDEILSHHLALIGPPSAHTWLSVSPLFYWLMMPFLPLFNDDPYLSGYFGAFLGTIIIIVNYLVIARIYDKRTAVFSSLMISLSPLWLNFAREARFTLPSLLLFYPFLLCFYRRKFFLAGLFFGLMLDFHYAPLILLPGLAAYFFFKKIRFDRHQIIRVLGGLTLGSMPILVCNAAYGGKMVRDFLLWIPYRLVGFLGLYPKNNLSAAAAQENFHEIFRFINLNFWPVQNLLMPSFLGILAVFIFFRRKESRLPLVLLVFGLVALFIHGAPPIHYFLPILPLPVILVSLFLSWLWLKKLGKLITVIFLLVLIFFNLTFLFSKDWFYKSQDRMSLEPFFVPYKIQQEIAREIADDAQGQPFTLLRVGPYDIYNRNYIQNYQYLLWRLGNEPSVGKTDLVYTIYEDRAKVPAGQAGKNQLIQMAGITVLKEK